VWSVELLNYVLSISTAPFSSGSSAKTRFLGPILCFQFRKSSGFYSVLDFHWRKSHC